MLDIKSMQEEFLRQQNELRDMIEPVDKIDMNSVKLIAGVDLAYWKDEAGAEQAVCGRQTLPLRFPSGYELYLVRYHGQ